MLQNSLDCNSNFSSDWYGDDLMLILMILAFEDLVYRIHSLLTATTSKEDSRCTDSLVLSRGGGDEK